MKMKKILSLALSMALIMGIIPMCGGTVSAVSAPVSTAPTRATSKEWDFNSTADLQDFTSSWWSTTNTNSAQIIDAEVTDSYALVDGALVRTRRHNLDEAGTTGSDWGVINNVTALTVKDTLFKNFDAAFRIMSTTDNDYSKHIMFGFRNLNPGQVTNQMPNWISNKDTGGNIHNHLSFMNNGGVDFAGQGNIVAARSKDYINKFIEYRVKVVGNRITIWAEGEQIYDAEYTGMREEAGYLSIVMVNMPAKLDYLKVTSLDENGAETAFPYASTKSFYNNLGAGDLENHMPDFRSSFWSGSSGYNAYDYVDNDIFVSEGGYLRSKNDSFSTGVSADNMSALTIDEANMRNFDMTVSLALISEWHPGFALINMREQTPGKAFSHTYNEGYAWPAAGLMKDGSKTAALVIPYGTGVDLRNGDDSNIKAVGTKNATVSQQTYRVRLVGNTLETWINGVKGETVTGLNVAATGYVSIIAANAGIYIGSVSVTWLDEDGNEADWGTNRAWDFSKALQGTTGIFKDFGSSLWSNANGFSSSKSSVDPAYWNIGTWGSAENTNGITANNGWANGFADNMAALTLKESKISNFDLTVNVKALHVDKTVMISMRESQPGRPSPTPDNWDIGSQPNGDKHLVATYFTNETNLFMYDGVKTRNAVTTTGISGLNWNKIRIRVVGDKVESWVNDVKCADYTMDESCNDSGYISVIFANTPGALSFMSLTRLDENGEPVNYDEASDNNTATNVTATEYYNGFDSSLISLLNDDFDFYYSADAKAEGKAFNKLTEATDVDKYLSLYDGKLNRINTPNFNRLPNVNNIKMVYKNDVYKDVSVEATISNNKLLHSFKMIEVGITDPTKSVYAGEGYQLLIQNDGIFKSYAYLLGDGKILKKVSFGANDYADYAVEGYNTILDKSVITFNVTNGKAIVTVTDKSKKVITLMDNIALPNYKEGYVAVGFADADNIGTYFEDISIKREALSPVVENVTENSITLKALTGYEYSLDGKTFQDSNIFTGLTSGTTYLIYQRIKDNGVYSAGTPLAASYTLVANTEFKPLKPELASATYNTVTLKAVDGYEYSINGTDWQTSPVFEDLMGGTEYTVYTRLSDVNGRVSDAVTVKTDFAYGDADGNGTVSESDDLAAIANYIVKGSAVSLKGADVTLDGEIGITDLIRLKKYAAKVVTELGPEIPNSNKSFEGKSALYLGDSIAYGANDTTVGYSWAGRIRDIYGLSYRKTAQSGWALQSNLDRGIIESQLTLDGTNPADYDYIFLHGGVNDLWITNSGTTNWGTITPEGTTVFDTTSICGALESLIYSAKTMSPDARLGFIINFRITTAAISDAKWDTYTDYVKQVCEKWDVPYLDLGNNPEINTVFNITDHTVDGVHPDGAGYEILAQFVGEWIKTI